MGIRKELLKEGSSIEVKEEGIMMGRIKNGGERWRIVRVYVKGDIERTGFRKGMGTLQRLEQWVEGREIGVRTIIGRDFNGRRGEVEEEEVRRGRD